MGDRPARPGGARRRVGEVRQPAWTRTPPLVVSAVAMLLLLAILPSALNLPQTNPAETLEYAPVPPEDADDLTPPTGNLSSLGLGTSRSPGPTPGAAGGARPEGGALPGGKSKTPSTKRCVGTPPRQTSDPLSPPCVAHYEGDNGGATHFGVSRDEIVVVVYADGGAYSLGTSKGTEPMPEPGIVDFDQPPEGEEHPEQRAARALARFFNDRFQTYNRHVHVYMYWTDGLPSAERQRADAVEIYQKLKPFAVLPLLDVDHSPMVDPLARRGVLVIGSADGKPASFYRKYPGLLWGYLPSIEKHAEVYAAWICEKVVGRSVSFSGNPDQVGRPRVLGLLYSTDPYFPGYTAFAEEVERRVIACGGEFKEKRAIPIAGWTVYADQSGSYPVENMSAFAAAGVTTIIWPQGYDTRHSQAAASINYRPEWFTAGDGQLEGHNTNQYQDQSVWRYAWSVSTVVMADSEESTPCYQAISEGDPEMHPTDVGFVCALYSYYEDYRQLFTGIQVAGPKLSPKSMEKGFRASPRSRARTPGCRPASTTQATTRA